MQERFDKDRQNLIDLAQVEQRVNEAVRNQLNRIIDSNRTQLRQVKKVLRTPRLYEQFRGLFL